MDFILNILYFLTDDVLEVRYKEPGTYEGPGLTVKWTTSERMGGTVHRVLVRPENSLRFGKVTLSARYHYTEEDRIFVNGYQSWTESREYGIKDELPPLKGTFTGLMDRSGDYTFYKYPKEPGRFHSYSWSYVRREEEVVFVGSLDEASGYTIIEHDVEQKSFVVRKAADYLVTDEEYELFQLFVAEGDASFAFNNWFRELNLPPAKAAPATGWTSWYNHYTKISAEIIRENLKAFTDLDLPIDFFQIDDGWQPAVGDWLETNEKFPKGLKPIAEEIQSKGIKAGLWLAPFICEKKSKIYREHRDWLVTYDGEHLVKAGFNPLWGGMLNGNYFILNLEMPEVRAYLKEVMDKVLNEWGFDLVKLDFLYAAGLYTRGAKTRGQRMSEAMDFLREICGNKLILGCGVPLAPSFGKVDYCRIGCDTHLGWDYRFFRKRNLRERISTVATIRDSIFRRQLDGKAFLNDPDVYILREENAKLDRNQAFTLFLVNLLFGSLVLTSDNPSNYDEKTLRLYRGQFPHQRKLIEKVKHDSDHFEVHFRIGEGKYLAHINLADEERTFSMEEGSWFESFAGLHPKSENLRLEPFQSRCFRSVPDRNWAVIGSDIHVFPGSEASLDLPEGDGARFLSIDERVRNEGHIWIRVPAGREKLPLNGKLIPVEQKFGISFLKFPVER